MPTFSRVRPLCIVAAVALAACHHDDATAPNDDVTDVYASGSIYTPATAEITKGGTVRFHMTSTSEGEGHNAIFRRETPGAPDDINIVSDTVVTRVFTVRGTFSYYCTVHPGMMGDVVVN